MNFMTILLLLGVLGKTLRVGQTIGVADPELGDRDAVI